MKSRVPARRLLGSVALTLAVVLAAAACGDSDGGNGASATTTTLPANDPVYARPGPYAVGFTTLRMDDRDVAVFYPADDAAVAGKPKASYDQRTVLPENLKGLVPDEYNTPVEMDAYAGVPASARGPFPVVLFSHGAGAHRLINSALGIGIASWGFVFVSADYLEYGLVAQVTGARRPRDPGVGRRHMLASLELVVAESGREGSVLRGAVDGSRVASAGHSAGGGTAFNALTDARVQTAVGWAPVPPSGSPADKPVMIVGAFGDIGLGPEELRATYGAFAGPKRLVIVGDDTVGHNTFTDLCPVIRAGGGLVEFARRNRLVSENLLRLATNGCAQSDLDPARFWPVVQHFTVAELRNRLGIDPQPAGLGDGIATAFGEITIAYEHQP
jgi:dienelactone hydrolase